MNTNNTFIVGSVKITDTKSKFGVLFGTVEMIWGLSLSSLIVTEITIIESLVGLASFSVSIICYSKNHFGNKITNEAHQLFLGITLILTCILLMLNLIFECASTIMIVF